MAHAARIATRTVTVVVRARGALMGSTSSSTSPTTASASARPTNTTNAYIFVPPSRRAARRSHQVRLQVRPLVTAVRQYFLRGFFDRCFFGLGVTSGRVGGRTSRMYVDPALVRACQKGEAGALDALIRATYADVYALCRRILADPDEAADATQEVFLRVMRSVVGFRGDAAFGTWLHRVTVNVCLTLLRKRSKARAAGMVAGGTPFALPGDDALLASTDTAPDDAAETADLLARSEAALAQLPEDARAVVVLRDIEGLSTKEVAELLGVTESVVKVRLHRAHARLRTMLVGQRSGEVGGFA